MRTKHFFLLLLIIAPALVNAQPVLFKSKPGDKNHGISTKMLYEVILDSKFNRQEIIKKTRDYFIASRLLDSANFPVKDISEQRAEYSIPLGYRQGVYYGKGTMGARLFKAPVYLFFKGKFIFEGSKLKISFSDFAEVPFFLVRNGKYYMGEEKGLDPVFIEMRDSIYSYYAASTAETSVITKGLLAISGGMSNYRNTINDINKAMDQQYRLYDEAVSKGAAIWVKSTDGLIGLFDDKSPGARNQIPMAKERAENGYLLVVDNERWENHFEKTFNALFLDVATLVQGSIVGVAKDGVIKYVQEGSKLEPQK